MNEIVIEAKDISVGHETPQERLAKLGAKVVPYETNERWVIDDQIVYIERTPIDWRKIFMGGDYDNKRS